MLESHPPRFPGLFSGIAVVAGILLLDGFLASRLLTRPVTLASFGLGLLLLVSVPASLAVSFLVRGLQKARYRIDDGALIVDWRGFAQRVPLGQIRRVLPGTEVEAIQRFRGVRFPGLVLGRGQAVLAGQSLPLRVIATRGTAHQVLVQTDQSLLAISPADPENFRACVHALKGASDGTLPLEPDRPLLAGPFWRDRLARGLFLVPVFLNLALFAYLSAIFPRLPEVVALRFGPGGQIVRTGMALQLFFVPLLALFGWLVNGGLGWYFYRWQKAQPTAYLLWAASCGLQFAAWIGLIGLTRPS